MNEALSTYYEPVYDPFQRRICVRQEMPIGDGKILASWRTLEGCVPESALLANNEVKRYLGTERDRIEL